MKNVCKKISAVACAVAVTALGACTSSATISFDEVKPWHDGAASYEKLVFDNVIYDTTEENSYVTIAEGTLEFVLNEDFATIDGVPYTELTMTSTVTYNNLAPEIDRGLTDEIRSRVVFQSSGLAASTMEKVVTLAKRDGVEDLSYTVTADYFGTHTVTRTMYGETQSLEISQGAWTDNEMLFYLARATKLDIGSSTAFNAVNVFDSFNRSKPKLMNYSFGVSVSSDPLIMVFEGDNDWVKNFGIAPVTGEDGKITYPVPCYMTGITLSASKSGPPYIVQYSAVPFTEGKISPPAETETDGTNNADADKKTHSKIPLKIAYSEYTGTTRTRLTEYTLSKLTYEKE